MHPLLSIDGTVEPVPLHTHHIDIKYMDKHLCIDEMNGMAEWIDLLIIAFKLIDNGGIDWEANQLYINPLIYCTMYKSV